MAVKLVVLKSDEHLIADVKEIRNQSDDVVGYYFNDPLILDLYSTEEESLLLEDQKEEVLTPYTLADRNEILVKYANFSFKEALAEVKDELKIEKDFHRRLGLLAAQSWILRKKLYVALHDPYISALSEVEDTDIFDGLDEDDYNEYDSLFDETTPKVKIEILTLKATTIDGKKIAKDTIVEVEEKEANKLIDAGNAKLVSE